MIGYNICQIRGGDFSKDFRRLAVWRCGQFCNDSVVWSQWISYCFIRITLGFTFQPREGGGVVGDRESSSV